MCGHFTQLIWIKVQASALPLREILFQGKQPMPTHVVLVASAVSAAFIGFALVLAWAEKRTRKN